MSRACWDDYDVVRARLYRLTPDTAMRPPVDDLQKAIRLWVVVGVNIKSNSAINSSNEYRGTRALLVSAMIVNFLPSILT